MEACTHMKYELVVQRKKGEILSYHIPKRPKSFKKYIILILKSSSLKTESNRAFQQKLCASILAYSESCDQCEDFGT